MRRANLVSVVFLLLAGGCQHARDPAPLPDVTERRLGHEFRECVDCPAMIVIPGGSFVMGASPDEPRAPWFAPEGKGPPIDPEGPPHTVSVPSFAIGKFDVTRAQWAAFAVATNRGVSGGCEWSGFPREEEIATASWRHLGFAQDANHPVVCVSWIDERLSLGRYSKP